MLLWLWIWLWLGVPVEKMVVSVGMVVAVVMYAAMDLVVVGCTGGGWLWVRL